MKGPLWSALRAAPIATAGPSSVPARYIHGAWRIGRQRVFERRQEVRFNSQSASSKGPNSSTSVVPHPSPAFDHLVSGLSSTQPCFGARGDEIELLASPVEFYEKLIEMISRAKRRIIISSLYIGVEEVELIDTIRTALEAQPQLRISFILDYHRATRLSRSTDDEYPPSTAHLLLPLLEKFPDRCEVWLYRSPKLRGIMEQIVPTRYDEGWGTWHAKWYGVDDEVILSGANLAHSYFTNRQDRYIHFQHHPSLLSYLTSLSRLITQYSYRLIPSIAPSLSRHHVVPLPQPSDSAKKYPAASLIWPTASLSPRGFSNHALATLTSFQNSWRASNPGRLRRVDADTYFWPVIQAGVLGVKEEEAALAKVWTAVAEAYPDEEERVSVDLTSGYFGLYKTYKRAVVDSPATYRVIAASPRANGFYGSAGFSRLIPEGYTLLESRFWDDARRKGRTFNPKTEKGVRLKEWEREGWTYHAKGVWVQPTKAPTNPFLTFIGSSNLSTRSLTLDTELSVLLTTSSHSLRRALSAEVKALSTYTKDVSAETWGLEERKVSTLTKVLVALGVEGML